MVHPSACSRCTVRLSRGLLLRRMYRYCCLSIASFEHVEWDLRRQNTLQVCLTCRPAVTSPRERWLWRALAGLSSRGPLHDVDGRRRSHSSFSVFTNWFFNTPRPHKGSLDDRNWICVPCNTERQGRQRDGGRAVAVIATALEREIAHVFPDVPHSPSFPNSPSVYVFSCCATPWPRPQPLHA